MSFVSCVEKREGLTIIGNLPISVSYQTPHGPTQSCAALLNVTGAVNVHTSTAALAEYRAVCCIYSPAALWCSSFKLLFRIDVNRLHATRSILAASRSRTHHPEIRNNETLHTHRNGCCCFSQDHVGTPYRNHENGCPLSSRRTQKLQPYSHNPFENSDGYTAM